MVKVEGTLEKKNANNNYNDYKKNELTRTLILGLVGLVLVLMPGTLNKILGILVGVVLLVIGIAGIYQYLQNKITMSGLAKVKWAFTLKGLDNTWIGTLVIGILITILGVILIFSPFSGDAITKVTGAFLLVVAVFDLIDNYILQK